MDNLALDILLEETTEGFQITDDAKAEWALKVISEEKAEAQRYINVCETMIMEYKRKVEQAKEKLENKTSFLQSSLEQYFATVPHKETKTQETYKLPSGTLKLKYATPEFNRDEDKLTQWLDDNGYSEFIKTKTYSNWADFKKKVKVDNDKVITEDGEIVEGVSIMYNPAEFIVEV